jgi:hypothetical protein
LLKKCQHTAKPEENFNQSLTNKKELKKARKKAKAELLNNAIPLPNNIPSKAIMEEMLMMKFVKYVIGKLKKVLRRTSL